MLSASLHAGSWNRPDLTPCRAKGFAHPGGSQNDELQSPRWDIIALSKLRYELRDLGKGQGRKMLLDGRRLRQQLIEMPAPPGSVTS